MGLEAKKISGDWIVFYHKNFELFWWWLEMHREVDFLSWNDEGPKARQLLLKGYGKVHGRWSRIFGNNEVKIFNDASLFTFTCAMCWCTSPGFPSNSLKGETRALQWAVQLVVPKRLLKALVLKGSIKAEGLLRDKIERNVGFIWISNLLS